MEGDPGGYEQEHVHSVYKTIASHFSSTRYKPWPIIEQFISSLPTGSIGLDSGTGNGKYLPLPNGRPNDICTIGLDRSLELLQIAKDAGNQSREVLLGDALQCCWRPGIFDYAISIATIHHLSTPERRRRAVKKLLQSVSPSGGRILIYVWAVDQDKTSKRTMPSVMQTEETSPNGIDAFVPWVLSQTITDSSRDQNNNESQVLKRYYHFFAVGELLQLVHEAAEELDLIFGPPPSNLGPGKRGVDIIKEGYEKSNWFIELMLWTT